ncbi:MAG TPA: HDOD domain-containing protein [Kofleriaceae bacterium]|nr:HDOD domain-containing protein [Kofleriaceae bacterium]
MIERKRILFVDDEPALLAALSNLMRRDRHRWDLVFALGGAEALRALEEAPFDIVLTDMRMPEVDGLAVLAAVKKRSPRTIRIILSGYAESTLVLQALPLVHQFLSKPCDAKTLRATIERCGGDSRLPNDKTLTGMIGSLPCLPSVPELLDQLRRATRDPNVTIDTLITICEQDPALAAKVLQIANTTHFRGEDRPTSSIKVAVAMLGIEVMTSLASSEMVGLPTSTVCEALIGTIQQDAVDAARHARLSVTDPARADDAYSAALLHDIGRLVLAHELAEAYLPVIERARTTGAALWECERELLGVTHQAVGAHLLGMWALPPELVEACERHHERALTPALQVVAS